MPGADAPRAERVPLRRRPRRGALQADRVLRRGRLERPVRVVAVVGAWVERFDRRGTEPFELFGSKFGPQFCQNLRKICQNSSEIVKFEGC